jgi:hypothetical protein
MKTHDDDPETLRSFEEERLGDEASAPDLEALLARPSGRRRVQVRTARRIAIAAATFAAAAVLLVIRVRVTPSRTVPESSALSPEAIALVTWKSPTDTLLETPGSDLWTQVPDLAPPVPAVEEHIPVSPTKGVAE